MGVLRRFGGWDPVDKPPAWLISFKHISLQSEESEVHLTRVYWDQFLAEEFS